MKNEKKNKHMNLDDRIEIQECLAKNISFKDMICAILLIGTHSSERSEKL